MTFRYRDGTNESSQVVVWLWQTLESFTNDERVLFLRFVSGRSRLPVRVSEITQRFQISVQRQVRMFWDGWFFCHFFFAKTVCTVRRVMTRCVRVFLFRSVTTFQHHKHVSSNFACHHTHPKKCWQSVFDMPLLTVVVLTWIRICWGVEIIMMMTLCLLRFQTMMTYMLSWSAAFGRIRCAAF